MEVETAVRRRLLKDPTVTGYVKSKVFRHRLEEKIEGTAGRAIVVWRDGGWATPNPRRTDEFPIVVIDCHADPDRNEQGEVASLNAEDKAYAVFRAVKPLLETGWGERWGSYGSAPGLMVVSSKIWTSPLLRTQGDLHGSEPNLGETVMVRSRWALNVVAG